MSGIQNSQNRHVNINIANTKTKSADKKSVDQEKNTNNVNKQNEKTSVGTDSWNTQQIKDAGLELPSEYFICIYTDYFTFNSDTISRDFPDKRIQTLADLKTAIDELKAKGKEQDKSIQLDLIKWKLMFLNNTTISTEKKLDLRLKTVDNERNALNTEVDAVKKVINDITNKDFKRL